MIDSLARKRWRMLSPRWRKIIRDSRLNKLRTFLVVGAIAIGVFGVGLVTDADAVLSREMEKNYLRTNPASATIWTDPIDDNFIQAVSNLPALGDAEARRLGGGRGR